MMLVDDIAVVRSVVKSYIERRIFAQTAEQEWMVKLAITQKKSCNKNQKIGLSQLCGKEIRMIDCTEYNNGRCNLLSNEYAEARCKEDEDCVFRKPNEPHDWVDVIRCKYCKNKDKYDDYCHLLKREVDPADYCSLAERRKNEPH